MSRVILVAEGQDGRGDRYSYNHLTSAQNIFRTKVEPVKPVHFAFARVLSEALTKMSELKPRGCIISAFLPDDRKDVSFWDYVSDPLSLKAEENNIEMVACLAERTKHRVYQKMSLLAEFYRHGVLIVEPTRLELAEYFGRSSVAFTHQRQYRRRRIRQKNWALAYLLLTVLMESDEATKSWLKKAWRPGAHMQPPGITEFLSRFAQTNSFTRGVVGERQLKINEFSGIVYYFL